MHAFLSHTQGSGQDLTTTINLSLKLVVPEIQLFQDVSCASHSDDFCAEMYRFASD